MSYIEGPRTNDTYEELYTSDEKHHTEQVEVFERGEEERTVTICESCET